jgi:exopolyphosphatase/guanosine-5'-triphosphate,3'-diphosphate pyrophosphatase
VPGINPKRADIIVAGAAILETILEETRMQEIKISGRELRDGLLIDYLDRIGAPEKGETSIRLRSVLGLGRKCGFDEQHAMNVSRIALEMFDTGREIWLHRQGSGRRDLLHFAALLHDVGSFLSYNNHHLNSWYFIRNSDLLGFNQREIALIAADAFFHRRGIPGRKYPEAYGLDDRALETVKVHAILLRFAESLDRSHAGIVRHARFSRGEKNSVVLEIECGDECDLEIWGVQNHRESFQKVFEKRLMIKRV